MTGIEPRVALVFDHPSSRRRQLQPEMMGRPELKPTTTLFQLPITILIFQLKIGDICISLTHRSQASTSSDDAKTSLQSTSANDAGEMRPPPVPPSDRERQRSRSSSPLTSSKPAASSAKSTRLSPLKQVAFSDKVVLHSPTSTKNGSKSRFEDSKSDAKDDEKWRRWKWRRQNQQRRCRRRCYQVRGWWRNIILVISKILVIKYLSKLVMILYINL